MDYPESRRGDTCDTLHGHPVADPYRWLEDPDSPETTAWVEAQRRLCEAHLAELETRRHFHERVEELLGQPVLGLPVKVPGGYLVYHHDGVSNQPRFLWARDWRDTEDAEVLLDPNEWSADGTTSVQGLTVSPDGSTLCWVVSEAGSDWTTFHCRDLASGREWEPGVRTKFSFPVYLPDSRSLVVLRFPVEEDGTGAVTAAARDPHLVVVRPDGSVEDLTPGPQEPGTIHWPHVHLDRDAEGRPTGTGWLVDTLTVGTAHDNRIRVWPLTTEDGLTRVGEAADLVDGTEARHRVVGVEGDGLYLLTDDSGETDRLVRVDLRQLGEGPAELCEILPAEDDPVADADLAGGRLVVLRTVDVSPQISLHEFDGSPRAPTRPRRWGGPALGGRGRQPGGVHRSVHALAAPGSPPSRHRHRGSWKSCPVEPARATRRRSSGVGPRVPTAPRCPTGSSTCRGPVARCRRSFTATAASVSR